MSGLIGGALFSAQPAHAATLSAHNESAKWLTVNRASKTVALKLIADDTADNGGLNFDGYSQGTMNVEVPQGWTVRVSFQNHSSMMPHSVMIVPYAQRTNVSGFTTAFRGASTPRSTSGITQGTTQSFSFKANKSGTYAMVCAMPGHSAGGMWDKFTVSSKLKLPVVLVTE